MLKTKDLYDLTHTKAAELLEGCEYPWQALAKIKDYEKGKAACKKSLQEQGLDP